MWNVFHRNGASQVLNRNKRRRQGSIQTTTINHNIPPLEFEKTKHLRKQSGVKTKRLHHSGEKYRYLYHFQEQNGRGEQLLKCQTRNEPAKMGFTHVLDPPKRKVDSCT